MNIKLLNNILRNLDDLSERCGHGLAWITLLMMCITFLIVVLRYLFGFGSIAMQESVMYLHATLFMGASAYTLKCDEHVRVDIFYRLHSPKTKAWINLFGTSFLLMPVCLFIGWISVDYLAATWRIFESSPEAGGIPAVFLLKSLIAVFVGTLVLQGFTEILRNALIVTDTLLVADEPLITDPLSGTTTDNN